MLRKLLVVAAILAGGVILSGLEGRAVLVPAVAAPILSADPCQDPTVSKSSITISVGTPTTTPIIAAVTGKFIYACSWGATLQGTNPTVKFSAGDSGCSGLTDLTAEMAPAAGYFLTEGWGGMLYRTGVSQALCVTTGGSGVSLQGRIGYVQR